MSPVKKVVPRKIRKVCSRGHVFFKSSDCPVCPKCWSGYYRKQAQGEFPSSIGAPALRALLTQKISTFAKLAKYREAEILALHGVGPKAVGILKREMKKRSLYFKTA